MVTVDLNDLEDAVALVGDDGGKAEAWVRRDTGEVLRRTEYDPPDAPPLPDDIEVSDRYIEVPGSRELDLGTPLVFRFVEREMPGDLGEVREMFTKKALIGASASKSIVATCATTGISSAMTKPRRLYAHGVPSTAWPQNSWRERGCCRPPLSSLYWAPTFPLEPCP